jgi:hypothetical protein
LVAARFLDPLWVQAPLVVLLLGQLLGLPE